MLKRLFFYEQLWMCNRCKGQTFCLRQSRVRFLFLKENRIPLFFPSSPFAFSWILCLKTMTLGRYLFAILSWRLLYHIHTHTIRSLYLEVLVKHLREVYKISLCTLFRKEIIEAKYILLANIFYFCVICIWSNISLFIGIKPKKMK